MKRYVLILMAACWISTSCYSQNYIKVAHIQHLEKKYQSCLDEGTFMLGCSIEFYDDMDSCLNVVYKQLIKKLDEQGKITLKKEQLAWLKKRDLTFKHIDRTNKQEGQDGEMIRTDEKANFVKSRVLKLIRRLNK